MYALAVRIDLERAAGALGLPKGEKAFDDEIILLSRILRDLGFTWEYGEVYFHRGDDGLQSALKAVDLFRRVEWIRASIEEVRVFRLEDEADLTDIVRDALGRGAA